MVVTNVITFISYLTICLTLLYLARRTKRVIARDWAYFVVGFALFIIACGSTHLLEVVTTWVPVFWMDAWTNIVTAALSAYVAVMLIRRAARIAFGINDYAVRLANTETENQQLEENLFAARKIEEWSRTAATVSHEIRNPLEAIQTLQYLICTSAGVTPEIAELASFIGTEADRIFTISASTLSSIRQTSKPEVVDLCSIASSLGSSLGSLIREREIAFVVEASGDCLVEAFAGEARQVLLNLVRNACESIGRPGAKVTVNLTGTEKQVAITVADEGAGMDADTLRNLFHFGMSTKGEQGNGMGLWSVKHILKKHSGEITVRSVPGSGTQFGVRWPRTFHATPQELFPAYQVHGRESVDLRR